ncbi:MAG: hypothetical protein E5299_02141 [Burkholderia gladioli]|nr:MAG: hypothetical protein E5299_02141 [Burkholderia gladioli]
MYRFKTLSGHCLWARHIDSQATEVAVRVGVINRMGAEPCSSAIRSYRLKLCPRYHCLLTLDLCNNAHFRSSFSRYAIVFSVS